MAELGIMIEGQEGLTWERWRAICGDVDRLGFASLRRSDHLFSVLGEPGRDNLDCWTSLALAAEWTERVQIGPMVTPLTFKHPAVLAREAAAVDVLSGGRLLLGLGTGWLQAEHDAFGVRLPETMGERFDLLESGLERIKQTWAASHPRPVRGAVPILLGGKGLRRTTGLAARHASEWNLTNPTPETFRTATAALDTAARAAGREPAEIRRSIMVIACVGSTRAEARERAAALSGIIPRFAGLSPDEVLSTVPFGGSAEEVVERARPWTDAGVQLFMLQHFLLDDRDHLRVIAEEVLPALAGAG